MYRKQQRMESVMKNRKHRNILITLLMILVLMFGTMGTSIPAKAAESATVIAESVNIRNAPTTEGDNIIGSLPRGARVYILDEEKDDDGNLWYLVQLENGNIGYVRGDMVSDEDDADTNENTQQQEQQPQQEQQTQQPEQQQEQQTQQETENTVTQEQTEQTTTETQTTIDEDRKARISSEDYDPTTDKEEDGRL